MTKSNYQKIMLVGDSMIEFFDWQGRFPDLEVRNLGRSGESVEELRIRAQNIVERYDARARLPGSSAPGGSHGCSGSG